MALEWFCGYDYMSAMSELTTGIAPQITADAFSAIDTGVVRTGRASVRLGNSTTYFHKSNMTDAATRIVGTALRVADPLAVGQEPIIVLGDAGIASANAQVALVITTAGKLAVYRNRGQGSTGGTQLGSDSTNILSASTWYFVELVATIHNSTGVVEVYVNGSKSGWIDLTGQDTQHTANAVSNAVALCGRGSSAVYFDDTYILRTTGGVRTARLGDVKAVYKIASSGDGAVAQFTPSSGTDNGAMVDDVTPDDATTYNASATVGFIDTYAFAAIGTVGTIYGLHNHSRLAKSDAGTCDAQTVQRTSATNYFGTQLGTSTTWGYQSTLYEQSPATTADYTASEIDGSEFGTKHTA